MEVKKEQEQADRFDSEKIRYDLIPPYALEQLAKIFTFGAKKYLAHNWKKGMPWSKVEASLRRHLQAYAAGEDYDYDKECEGCQEGTCTNHSGIFHMAAVVWNATVLLDYYKSNPRFDDRLKAYLKQPKIVLDIDEVVCGWAEGYQKKTGKKLEPSYWDSTYGMTDDLEVLAKDKEFWIGLPCIRKPDFVPLAYISSRGIPVDWTKEWLEKNGLPCRPVYHVPWNASKVEKLKEIGAEYFIDDRFDNFIEAESAGICSFLMDASHNQHYDVGYRRVKRLKLKDILR